MEHSYSTYLVMNELYESFLTSQKFTIYHKFLYETDPIVSTIRYKYPLLHEDVIFVFQGQGQKLKVTS